VRRKIEWDLMTICSNKKKKKKNLIKYTPQKRTHNDNIVKNISSTVTVEENFKTTMDMEQEYYSVISSKLHKETCVQVERDRKEKMIKQFHVMKNKQFIQNWFVLFMQIRNHNNIIDSYYHFLYI